MEDSRLKSEEGASQWRREATKERRQREATAAGMEFKVGERAESFKNFGEGYSGGKGEQTNCRVGERHKLFRRVVMLCNESNAHMTGFLVYHIPINMSAVNHVLVKYIDFSICLSLCFYQHKGLWSGMY